MYLQFFKVFPIVKGRALSTFSVFYKMWNNLEPTDNILRLQKIFPILFFQLKQCFLHVGDKVSSKKLTARKAHKKIRASKAIKKERHSRHVKGKTIKAHKTLWHVRHAKKGRHVRHVST